MVAHCAQHRKRFRAVYRSHKEFEAKQFDRSQSVAEIRSMQVMIAL